MNGSTTVGTSLRPDTIQGVAIVLVVIVTIVLLAAISFAFYIIMRQRQDIRSFAVDNYTRQRIARYKKMGTVSPGFIDNDLRQDLDQTLDSRLGHVNLIINSLSMLGLLGTFVGLSGSLGQLTQVLKQAVEPTTLTSFVAFAFLTSVLGLLGALALNVFQRFNHDKIDQYYASIKETIFTAMMDKEAEVLDLRELAGSIQKSFTEGIQQLTLAQKQSFDQFSVWATELMKKKGDQIYSMVSSNEARLEKVIQKINDERKSIDDMKSNWQSAVSQLHESSKNLKSMSQNLDNFAKLSEEQIDQSKILIDRIGDFSASFHTQLALIRNMQDRQDQPSEIMNQLTIALSENINQNNRLYDLNVANQALLEQLVDKILTDVGGLMAGMTATFEAIKTNLDSQLKMIEVSTSQGHEQLKEILSSSNQVMLNTFKGLMHDLSDLLKSSNTELGRVIADNSKAIEASFPKQEEQLIALSKSITQLDAKLKHAFEHIINKGLTVYNAYKRP